MMRIYDKIRDEKLQYNINRETTFSSGNVDKYKYLTSEKYYLRIKVEW